MISSPPFRDLLFHIFALFTLASLLTLPRSSLILDGEPTLSAPVSSFGKIHTLLGLHWTILLALSRRSTRAFLNKIQTTLMEQRTLFATSSKDICWLYALPSV